MLPLLLLAVFAQAQKATLTEHGYMFLNHTNNEGYKPQAGDVVSIHAETWVKDSLLASTRKSIGAPRDFKLPEKANLPKRIPALYDAVMLMSKGDSVTVYEIIDSTLRKYLPPTLNDADKVRYEFVLVNVVTAQEEAAKLEAAKAKSVDVENMVQGKIKDYKAGALAAQIQSTPSGLKMLVLEKGAGAPVKKGENLQTHYYGALLSDGKKFDTSFDSGQPLSFQAGVGQMIPGYDEGVMQINHGGKVLLFIPYQLGYGEEGAGGVIPGKADLVFYVEVQ